MKLFPYQADFYFKVLKECNNVGLYKPCDISHLVAIYLADHTNARDVLWNTVDKEIDIYFQAMVKSGHIQGYINNTPKDLRFVSDLSYTKKISVIVEITTVGEIFYREHRKGFWTNWFAIIAIVISIASAIIGYFNYTKPSCANNQKTLKSSQEPKLKLPQKEKQK